MTLNINTMPLGMGMGMGLGMATTPVPVGFVPDMTRLTAEQLNGLNLATVGGFNGMSLMNVNATVPPLGTGLQYQVVPPTMEMLIPTTAVPTLTQPTLAQPTTAPIPTPLQTTSSSGGSSLTFSSLDAAESEEAIGAPLRVSGGTRVSGLAGAIAKRLRTSKYVAVEAMGAQSVATATTALALAKSFVNHVHLTVLVQVGSISAPPRDSTKQTNEHPGLRFVARAEPVTDEVIKFDTVRKIPAGSAVAKVAGSLAKMVRSSPKDSVIGVVLGESNPTLLNTAAKSIALARAMLRGNELDIICKPHFENNDQRANKIQFALYIESGKSLSTTNKAIFLEKHDKPVPPQASFEVDSNPPDLDDDEISLSSPPLTPVLTATLGPQSSDRSPVQQPIQIPPF
eukprot:TRINITY_DN8729_c0_g3_i1.p1 TRINITY_DN8729_c0_g3~~TRINITY_DN8729_c0_g3_i1.p1  ORF type:complete len:398 (+),score=100.49 TRINITY_DN8729_c0_g3_i1:72-1265(+)